MISKLVSNDTAHEVVGGWRDGDQIGSDVQTSRVEFPGDGRESAAHRRSIKMAKIKIDMISSVNGHLTLNAAGNDVARGKFRQFMNILHKAVAGLVSQVGSFPSYSF